MYSVIVLLFVCYVFTFFGRINNNKQVYHFIGYSSESLNCEKKNPARPYAINIEHCIIDITLQVHVAYFILQFLWQYSIKFKGCLYYHLDLHFGATIQC